MPKNPTSSKLVSGLLRWFAANARDLPWRRTRDPYAIWVSEIMLQQTQVKTVIPYWERWMRELPTIEALAKAKPDKTHKLWEGLGYYTRVRNMQKAAQQIIVEHVGKFPEDFDAVLALPGIGRYTAGAICSIAFNQPTPILDGNVIRVLTRVYGIAGSPRDKQTNARLWELAEELVGSAKNAKVTKSQCSPPPSRPSRETNFCSFFNQSMMELGALVCTPRNPKCESCPLKQLCVAVRERRVDELPNLGQRTATTERRFAAFIVERAGKFLVRQRPAGIVNAHFWEFPNEEIPSPHGSKEFRVAKEAKPFCVVRHSITRYRITLEAFRAKLAPRIKPSGRWLKVKEMDALPFTSAHRKILNRHIAGTKPV